MRIKFVILSLVLVLFVCGSAKNHIYLSADKEATSGNEVNWSAIREDAIKANEGFDRSYRLMHAWLKDRRGESKLFGDYHTQVADYNEGYSHTRDSAGINIWRSYNSAADCYALFVAAGYVLDKTALNGPLTEMLKGEMKYTNRDLGDGKFILPAAEWLINEHRFRNDKPNLNNIIFGTSEYIKDGLIPIIELAGTNNLWYDRLISMLDYLWESQAHALSDHSEKIIQASDRLDNIATVEAHGEMLQILPRIFWQTGDKKYLEWAIRLGNHYLIDGDQYLEYYHVTHGNIIKSLSLRDHGNEIVSGLVELYTTLRILDDRGNKDAERLALSYRTPIYDMLDYILEVGINEDALMYHEIHSSNVNTENPVKKSGLIDTYGYVYNAHYSVWLIDQNLDDKMIIEKLNHYRSELRRALSNLNKKYRNYRWDGGPLADSYADAIEGALNLYNREQDIEGVADWIDNEIGNMFAVQKDNGLVEATYPDGNFARTALMYSLWKTQGCFIEDWRKDIFFAAAPLMDGLALLINAKENDWKGKLIFEQARHQTFLNMPINTARINQFPEWFTITATEKYQVEEILPNGKTKRKVIKEGKSLLEGMKMNLEKGKELRFIIRLLSHK